MDVLELPRPVINFLRTMSKEMNRYSLCWDIFGGSESVTLTLTWRINDLLIENNLQQQQQPSQQQQQQQQQHQINNLIENLSLNQQQQQQQQNKAHSKLNNKKPQINRDRSVDSNNQQKLNNQQQINNNNSKNSIENDKLFNEMRKSRKQSIESNQIVDTIKNDLKPTTTIPTPTPTTTTTANRGKSLENLNSISKKNFKNNLSFNNINGSPTTNQDSNENIQTAQQPSPSTLLLNRSNTDMIINTAYIDALVKQCPPPSLAYMRRKNLNKNKLFVNNNNNNKQQMTPPKDVQSMYYMSSTSTSIGYSSTNVADPWVKRNNCSNELTTTNTVVEEDEREYEINDDFENSNNPKSITAVCTKLDVNNENNNNNSTNERKLSLQSTDSYQMPNNSNMSSSNHVKVTFDPNLHYI